MLQLCAPKATFGSFLAVMFLKMTLNHIWPSRFGGLCSAGLPLAPQKPAAAARAGHQCVGWAHADQSPHC